VCELKAKLASVGFVLFAEKEARLILHVELKKESANEETRKE
jgi:hypothetical protein